MSSDSPAVLGQARQIVAEQMARLRQLADQVRVQANTESAEQRQAERMLDELRLQQRFAAEQGRSIQALQQREAELRAHCERLYAQVEASRRAIKELEQLVRQIEMSSATLTEGTPGDDPWVRALRAQVITGREEERVRLAREVHDGPAQLMANSLMVVESCRGLAQQGDLDRLLLMLDRMRDMSREGLHEIRRFIADLRPGKLAEQGLPLAIQEYVRGYQDAYHARVNLDITPLPRLPAEIEIVLYRIVQESLQNAYKHARGATVHVRLQRQAQQLTLSIRDEGPGFDPREVARRAGRESWGLTSMRERAELIGARLTVSSRPGYGTEVLVILPLTPSLHDHS